MDKCGFAKEIHCGELDRHIQCLESQCALGFDAFLLKSPREYPKHLGLTDMKLEGCVAHEESENEEAFKVSEGLQVNYQACTLQHPTSSYVLCQFRHSGIE